MMTELMLLNVLYGFIVLNFKNNRTDALLSSHFFATVLLLF